LEPSSEDVALPMSTRAKPSGNMSSAPQAKRARKAPKVDMGPFSVDPIGFGSMLLGIEYPEPGKRPKKPAAIELLQTAFDSGVEMIDTADSYCAGPGGSKEAEAQHYVETLIREAIESYDGDASRIRVCTKGGMRRIDSTSRGWRPVACSASAVRQMVEDSRKALGGSKPLDLFMLHHTDALNAKLLEEVLKVLQGMVKEGVVLALGLANATVANLDLAERLGVRIAAVQNQYSLWQREAEQERPSSASATSRKGVLLWCASRGVAFMPYGVLGGVQCRDGRRELLQSFPQLINMAASKDVSPHALVLTWMRQRFPNIVHIVGSRGKQHVLDGAQARNVLLTVEELDAISAMKQSRAAPKVAPALKVSYIYMEKERLSTASTKQLTELEDAMAKLSSDAPLKGKVRIVVDSKRDRLCFQALGGDSGLHIPPAVQKIVEEVLQCHFGCGVPR